MKQVIAYIASSPNDFAAVRTNQGGAGKNVRRRRFQGDAARVPQGRPPA